MSTNRKVGPPSIISAWHKARGRKSAKQEIKDESGKVIEVKKVWKMNPGLSLKTWARNQAEGSGEYAALARAWLEAKLPIATAPARQGRRKSKGAVIDAQKRAPRTGRKGHKKGAGGRKGG